MKLTSLLPGSWMSTGILCIPLGRWRWIQGEKNGCWEPCEGGNGEGWQIEMFSYKPRLVDLGERSCVSLPVRSTELLSNARLQTSIRSTNIFQVALVGKARVIFHRCRHTVLNDRNASLSPWWRTTWKDQRKGGKVPGFRRVACSLGSVVSASEE